MADGKQRKLYVEVLVPDEDGLSDFLEHVGKAVRAAHEASVARGGRGLKVERLELVVGKEGGARG